MNCATLCPTSMCALVANGDAAFSLPVDSDEVQSFWTNVLVNLSICLLILSMWRCLQTSLRLTEHQELLLLELRRQFLQHLEMIWKKRTLLSNRLQARLLCHHDLFFNHRIVLVCLVVCDDKG